MTERQGTALAVPPEGKESGSAVEGMGIPHRHASIPGTYFVTSRTWESRCLFVNEPMCTVFVETLFRYQTDRVYGLHAFVLMPDHFHILLTPAQNVTLEKAVQFIKGGSARKLGIEGRLRFPVWQRGFSDHRIRNTADYASHLHYIEQNPVRKNLAIAPRDYRWSSAAGVYTMDVSPQGLKPQEGTKQFGTAEAVP